MSRNVSVTEPHPSVARTSSYLSSGRGGAGNYKKYSNTEVTSGPNATGPAALLNLTTRPSVRTVPAGRGGAGNFFARSGTEERVFQFDEEMMQRREMAAPVYHIGRGGAANFVKESKPRVESPGSEGSVNSEKSDGSSLRRSAEGMMGKLARKWSTK